MELYLSPSHSPWSDSPRTGLNLFSARPVLITCVMADIFISYAKAARPVTEQLASELQAKGFTVWWDSALVSGESFRSVILSELANARAAIVIWTAASVKSEWVISEADRARRRGILIPVREADVGPDDIPPPFDGLHTDLVTNRPAIDAALARLGVTPAAPKALDLAPTPKTGLAASRRAIAAAVATVLAGSVAAGIYAYWYREMGTVPPVVWVPLPVGTRLANATSVPVATYVRPDRRADRSIDIEPGRTIPPSGTNQVLARATIERENWLRFPVGTGGQFGYVPEQSVKLLPTT
jgi:hypothetical protein